MKQRKNDILWKVIIEELFPDALRFVFPDAPDQFDLGRGVEFLDKELAELHPQPDKGRASRFADKLVKVYYRGGSKDWTLFHFEVQGYTPNRKAFAQRMFDYYYRIWDKYRRPVTAVAIFTDVDGDLIPNVYKCDYMGTRLEFEFNTVPVLKYDVWKLRDSTNPFAQVMLTVFARQMEGVYDDETLLELKLFMAKKLQEKGFDDRITRALFVFLRNYLLFEEPEMNRKFDQMFHLTEKIPVMDIYEYEKLTFTEEGREEGRAQGRIQGLERGRQEAQRRFVENMLSNSDLSLEKIASLADVTLDFVTEVKIKMKLA